MFAKDSVLTGEALAEVVDHTGYVAMDEVVVLKVCNILHCIFNGNMKKMYDSCHPA